MKPLHEWSAREITTAIQQKEVSACEITEAALARLQSVNSAINAVIDEMPEQALAAAEAVDKQVSNGNESGILAGVPVTVKVNIDQVGFANTNGLRIQQDQIAQTDNPVVSSLRKAGAIIIGRTNTPAFSLRWFTRNSLHGHTLNSYNKNLTPGGSSGGAASAVAAGIGAIAHGTDIAGSIRYPAYACGVHGIRPTPGRVAAVNLSGPDRHIGAQLTAVSGPLARCIDDLELGYTAMSVSSSLDPWWIPAPHRIAEYPKRAALCIAPEDWQVAPSIVNALNDTARQLRDAGWEVVETECPPLREPKELQLLLWMSEYARTNGEAFKAEDDPDANFVYAQLLENSLEVTLNSFMDALQRRLTLAREWQRFLTEYSVMLCPVSAELPFEDLRDVKSADDFRAILEAQLIQIALPLIGMPGMTVTTGSSADSPIGVQLIAARFREDILFDAARIIEASNPAIAVVNPV
jgi:amidase